MSRVTITNAEVWNGIGFDQWDLIIEDRHIARIVPGKVSEPDDGQEKSLDQTSAEGQVFDAAGKYVLPGLIDTHVHLSMDGSAHPIKKLASQSGEEALLEAVVSAEKCLLAGVTTVRDCGGYGESILYLRDAVTAGKLKGPRILSCGSALKTTGGHFIGVEVNGVEEMRRAARRLIEVGVDFLKVMATGGLGKPGEDPGALEFDLDELEMAVRQGRKHGLKSASHAHGKEGILTSLAAGVDTIEHGTFMDEEVVQELISREAFLVPTFSPYMLIAEYGAEGGIFPHMVDMAKGIVEEKLPRFQHAYEQGVKIAFGRDAGAPFTDHGDFAVELKAMVSAGMAERDVIQAATQVAAEAIGIHEQVGSIEVGKIADLLILPGDPLKDIAEFQNVCQIMKEGVFIN